MALQLNSQQVGLPSLLKEGVKHLQGTDEALLRNISACKALTEILRSSFGPNGINVGINRFFIKRLGLNKLVLNNLDKLFLTNDAGTIMRELEVEHPAAKLLLMASQQQDKEMGDGTNLVILLAGELLLNAEELLRIGIRPSIIVEGYELAYKKTMETIEQLPFEKISNIHNRELLKPILKSVLGSKQNGWEDTLSNFVLDAIQIAFPNEAREFNPENVRCVKILGSSLPSSQVIAGLVIEREPMGQVKKVKNAKIAVFACPLNTSRTETKGTVLIKGAQDLLDFSKGEEKILEQQIRAIADSGVNVVITGDTIGELAMHFIERTGMMALKIPSKFELRRLCKAASATPLARLGAPTAEEAGFCDIVETIEIGGERCTVFKQSESDKSRLATIILRSNTQNFLDDVERAIDDALFTIRNLSKDPRVVVGAGATEMEISRLITEYGETTPGIAQYAIRKFAECFESVPRILADNAGLNSTQLMAKLSWSHNQGQVGFGVNIEMEGDSEIKDMNGSVYDLLAVKKSAIHLATEAALTVLRVDQIIMSKPAAGPRARPAGPQDADD